MDSLLRTESRQENPSGQSSEPATGPGRATSRFTGQHVHFIGIGGCGMSGLARMLLDAGAIVTGSDPKPNAQTEDLVRRGATIVPEQTGKLLAATTDLVVRTAAIPDHNPEYRAAVRLGLNQIKYAQLLGQVMQERLGVAVSGTHGKSTTTAMISYALLKCRADPSFVIGGTVPQLGGSSRSGAGEAFVVEACEFDRSFHNLYPRVAVITNIEADHLDCYAGGIGEIVESFRVFAKRVPADGLVIANGQDAFVQQALSGLGVAVERVGLDTPESLTWCTRVLGHEDGKYRGQVLYKGTHVGTLRLSVPGRHNLFNATAAVAACHACGVDPSEAADALEGFAGVDRRMSEVGRYNGAIVADDYGHHPTEIRTTLRALREKYSPKRLICVFQPHQHSRTRYLLDEFATCFVDADLTIIPDIYAARDTDDDKRAVSTVDLIERVKRNGHQAVHLATFPQILDRLRTECRAGDLVVTMGAGNVCDIGGDLVAGRREQ
jgi:UDP-N-acetylmuramate--alanine ligase